jgi:hypothetical protein
MNFQVALAGALSIHKSQGLSLYYVNLNIGPTEFAIGLSYVAASRVTDCANLTWCPTPSLSRLVDWRNSPSLGQRKNHEVLLEEMAHQTILRSDVLYLRDPNDPPCLAPGSIPNVASERYKRVSPWRWIKKVVADGSTKHCDGGAVLSIVIVQAVMRACLQRCRYVGELYSISPRADLTSWVRGFVGQALQAKELAVEQGKAAFTAQLEIERNAKRAAAGPGAASLRRDEKAGKKKADVTKTRVPFKGEAADDEAGSAVAGSKQPRPGKFMIPHSALIVIKQTNPKSGETRKRYETYKVATTLGQFYSLGGTFNDLKADYRKKFLQFQIRSDGAPLDAYFEDAKKKKGTQITMKRRVDDDRTDKEASDNHAKEFEDASRLDKRGKVSSGKRVPSGSAVRDDAKRADALAKRKKETEAVRALHLYDIQRSNSYYERLPSRFGLPDPRKSLPLFTPRPGWVMKMRIVDYLFQGRENEKAMQLRLWAERVGFDVISTWSDSASQISASRGPVAARVADLLWRSIDEDLLFVDTESAITSANTADAYLHSGCTDYDVVQGHYGFTEDKHILAAYDQFASLPHGPALENCNCVPRVTPRINVVERRVETFALDTAYLDLGTVMNDAFLANSTQPVRQVSIWNTTPGYEGGYHWFTVGFTMERQSAPGDDDEDLAEVAD